MYYRNDHTNFIVRINGMLIFKWNFQETEFYKRRAALEQLGNYQLSTRYEGMHLTASSIAQFIVASKSKVIREQ
jgi:hypothetical protein